MNDPLSWKNIKGHAPRLHVAKSLAAAPFLTISSVVVLKRQFPAGDQIHREDVAYLYTLRYLLERPSWIGRDQGGPVDFTLAHIIRFQIAKLRSYEQILHADAACQIVWASIAGPGQIDQPNRNEFLQLADLAASATAAAFEPDGFGNTETRYLEELAPRLYRRNGNLTSYGLKMHPWTPAAHAAYPWVQAL